MSLVWLAILYTRTHARTTHFSRFYLVTQIVSFTCSFSLFLSLSHIHTQQMHVTYSHIRILSRIDYSRTQPYIYSIFLILAFFPLSLSFCPRRSVAAHKIFVTIYPLTWLLLRYLTVTSYTFLRRWFNRVNSFIKRTANTTSGRSGLRSVRGNIRARAHAVHTRARSCGLPRPRNASGRRIGDKETRPTRK